MKFQREVLTGIVKAQVDHLLCMDPQFPNDYDGYMFNVIVCAGKVLELNQGHWTRVTGFKVPHAKVLLPSELMVKMFVYMITQSAKEKQRDLNAIVDAIMATELPSTDFETTINTLIQAATNKQADYASYFKLLALSGVNEQTLQLHLIAHFALTKFRIEQGYMGLRPGNYIPEDIRRNWNDSAFTMERARVYLGNPKAIDLIQQDLKNAYELMLVANVVPLKRL